MDKKKAVKLATASAVAASAFVAANPNASEAATDVATVVSQAKAQFKKAYYTYSHTVTETGEFPNINDVYAEYNKAKKAYADAVALVNKAGGAKKDAYLADLQKEYETYVFKANPKSGEARVATYIDAYNYATKLDKMRQELEAAVQAKDLEKAEQYYHKISYELKTRTVILDRVYGKTTRDLLRSAFKAEAQKLRDSLIYDITVAMKAREAQEAVKAGDLDKAKVAVDQINQYLPKVTDAFKTELTEAAKKALDAYEAALTPKVESVSAINLKQIEIKFNKAVDKDTVVIDNFKVSKGATESTITSAELSEDGKTVTLTVQTPLEQKGEYRVFGFNLKATTGAKFPSFVQDITVEDTVAPKIVSASAVTKDDKVNSFTLKFSEPVSFTTIKVGDSILGAAKVDDFTYTVSGKELEVGKSYEVEVYGLTDLAGNKGGTPERASIVVTKDAVKPNFVINAVGPKTFEIKFDKDMNTAVAVDSIKVKDAKGNAVALKALPSFKDDKRTLVVELAKLPFEDDTVNSATLDVTVQALQDKLGNVVDTKTVQVTLVRDTVKPAIKEAKFTAANEIEVEFSEAVTGVEAGDFYVNKQDGTAATTVSNVTPVTGTNKYKLTLASSLKNGSYNLVLKVNAVSDDSSNTNAAQVLTITNDKEVVTPVAPLSAYIQSTGVTSADKTVTITFDKSDVLAGVNPATGDLYVDGADNKALYSINGAALPAKAKVIFKNDQSVSEAVVNADLNKDGDKSDTVVVDTVTIDLSEVDAKDLVGPYAAFGNGGTATISVGGVKNAAGAILPLTSLPVVVVDATKPVVKEAYITGNATNGYKLIVKFSEAMKAVDEADFVLAGKADASTPAEGITLGTAVLSADGLSAEIPVTSLGNADRTLGFTLNTDIQENLDSTTDKADNPLTEITTPITVTNFTTN
ncbi:hypothetical protein DER53_03550 [Parageobacillus toebii NBRC 107807]|uniref:Methionine-rich copper-binding protein CopC n=1 Tax=Parageobacillus toebii NBRC 107807 TaxID=1223503 RepID=A0A6G9J1R3_9BACL|nr:Ig-like domain-containing protein [Parageobacillus toebii]MBB3868678.1 methionine-rich copper-binding protein CopC [Parageobacillus toebii NBRC 107807]QIQ32044.1 hypothetical protein DER53_03550 [Parageobacillus toebii NBRC 107807]